MGPGVLETLPGLATLRWPGSKALLARFRAVECRRSVADSLGPTALAHNPAANGREAHISGAIALKRGRSDIYGSGALRVRSIASGPFSGKR